MSNLDLPRKKKGDPLLAADWNRIADDLDELRGLVQGKGTGATPSSSPVGYNAPERLVPCRIRSIFQGSDQKWSFTLNPFFVMHEKDVKNQVYPKYEAGKVNDSPYPKFTIDKPELYLITKYTKVKIVESEIKHEIPASPQLASGEKLDILYLGKFEVKKDEPRWLAAHEGNYILKLPVMDLSYPFEVVFSAPEEEGAAPKWTVNINGGRIAMIGISQAPPYDNKSSAVPDGLYIYDGDDIKQDKAFEGKFAYLVADFDLEGKVKFSFEGSPYEAMLAECTPEGRPKKTRVCLAQYNGSQYVSTQLYLSPVFFGAGGYYLFMPFLGSPNMIPDPPKTEPPAEQDDV